MHSQMHGCADAQVTASASVHASCMQVVTKLKGVEDCVEKKCKHKRDKLKAPAPSKKSTWGARRLLQVCCEYVAYVLRK